MHTRAVKLATLLLGVALLFPSLTFASSVQCLCVGYLNQVLGVNIHGNADSIIPNAPITTVVPGDVLLFYYASTGIYHAALVTNVDAGYLTISESNYHHCKAGSRTLYYQDSTIRGIYRPISPYLR